MARILIQSVDRRTTVELDLEDPSDETASLDEDPHWVGWCDRDGCEWGLPERCRHTLRDAVNEAEFHVDGHP